MGNLNICSSKDVFIENLTNGTITNTQISFIKDSKEIFTQGEYWGGDLNNKVDKVIGKQLSTEDFTSALKDKLQTLQNYDADLRSRIDTIQETIDTLFSKDTSSAIESFNEIIAFLEGIEDSENLDNIIASIESQLANKAEKTDIPIVLNILKSVYPVGAIYISTVSTSPKTLFGFGTWERIKDTFLLAAGDTYSAGLTGGEAEHTLTIDEMPIHYHNPSTTIAEGAETDNVMGFTTIRDLNSKSTGRQKIPVYDEKSGGAFYRSMVSNPSADDYGSLQDLGCDLHTGNTGGGLSHNNMPPYLTVYMWERTA